MNNEIKYKKINNILIKYSKISIFTHVDPDGDTIGSAVGLKECILNNYPNKEVKITGETFPSNLAFLDEEEKVSETFIKNSLAIIIDTSTNKRIADQRYTLALNKLKIDHHNDEGGEWMVNISGDHYAATGEIITDFIKTNDLKISNKCAQAILTAIYSDTERFTHRQINEATWERVNLLKSNGANLKIIEEKYNDLGASNEFVKYIFDNKIIKKNTAFIKIPKKIMDKYKPDPSFFKAFVRALVSEKIIKWTLMVELDNYIRIGIRSNEEKDVSLIAKKHGGGGHKTSAGTKVKTWEQANQFLKEFIKY